MKINFSGEYQFKGEYHKKLDKNWVYLPVYLTKIREIKKILSKLKHQKIFDAGCGEGVLVEDFKKKGYDIVGMDLNFSSKNVIRGNINNTKFKDNLFDVVLCLDVLEHVSLLEQDKILKELSRITKKEGLIIFGVPNLAHFASRLSFLFTGNLIRTSRVERHPGDRPINEFLKMIKNNGLKIVKRKGLFPTFPIISLITMKMPAKSLKIHLLYNFLFGKLCPNWCFENIIIVKNGIHKKT